MMTPIWLPPPPKLILSTHDVHIWRALIDREKSYLEKFQEILSDDEKKRAARFHFQKDQVRFILTHGHLRCLLSLYLPVEPSRLQFAQDYFGKPSLAGEFSENHLRFNLSHSEGVILFAFAKACEIGIDVEKIRDDVDWKRLSERFFHPNEADRIRSLPPHLQKKAFLNCWTRKEAYIKAKGGGLSISLKKFEVTLSPGEAAAIVRTTQDPDEAGRWTLHHFLPEPGYVAAVALEGEGFLLKFFNTKKNKESDAATTQLL